MSVLVRLVILISLSFNIFLKSFANELPPYIWTKVNNKITVALKPDQHRFIDSNITVIESEKFLIIVDAYDNLQNAHALIDDINQKWEKPVKYIINTHWHSDHILANQLYQDRFDGEQIFIAHSSFKQTLSSKAQIQLNEKREQWATAINNAKQKLKQDNPPENLAERIKKTELALNELNSIKIVTPDIFVSDKYEIEDASFPIDVMYSGLAHTEGDLIVWLPLQKVLISGDLFDEISFGGHGFISEWQEALNRINKLPFETVIPGHGRIQRDNQALVNLIKLLQDANNQAEIAIKKGWDKTTFMESLDLTKYYTPLSDSDELTQRASRKFLPEFFERAYDLLEQKNKP
ncbi:MAG: MBL fold metallo-hydrolase [Gammaproteobacteria bacterium]|nr:MBL fold metallo-hydrolase [Gammaproteobacteria bacterium]